MSTINPIDAAHSNTPNWMPEMRDYDGLEIWPCAIVGTTTDGRDIVEPCDPGEEEFWTVYGHRRGGGIDAFEDFGQHDLALAFASRLLETYVHLRQHGLSDSASRRHVPS